MKKEKKERLDQSVVNQNLAVNVDEARRFIMAGEIRTGDHVWQNAGDKIPASTKLERKRRGCKFVSRGGLKLEKALRSFRIEPAGLRCLDVGSSTGGFSHVLLENKADQVVAVDVGKGLLDVRIQRNPRVSLYEGVNFRLAKPDQFGDSFDLIVTDVSFISLSEILPVALKMLAINGNIIALIKPQFEASPRQIPQGGIITDPAVHAQVVIALQQKLKLQGLILTNLVFTDLDRNKKNIEYPSLWSRQGDSLSEKAILQTVDTARKDSRTSDSLSQQKKLAQ